MWSEHGWIRVTAEEATHLHPGGTVSAHAGLFMCELCGQYVTLADTWVRDRYFMHSAEELSKDCPERTFSTSVPMTFQAGSHDLPIRLRILSAFNFELQLGLLPVPISLLKNREQQIKIFSTSNSESSYIYSLARIQEGMTTYLSVGNVPFACYNISLTHADDRLTAFWPKTIEGISRSGTLFDSLTGKKLPYDADTLVNHKYYLLTAHSLNRRNQGVSATQVCRCSERSQTWYIYEVTATSFEESAARFFLNYHCRLTENAVAITPIWPVYIETPYMLRHCSDQMAIFLRGDAAPKVFPVTYMHPYACENGKVFFVNCKERQQILSAGRTKVLQYTYLWKDPLEKQVVIPKVIVKDIASDPLYPGEQTELPKEKKIIITSKYDGFAQITKGNSILERFILAAGEKTVLERIQNGCSIEVFQGLDLVWSVHYSRVVKINETQDETLLQELSACQDEMITVPHTIGALAQKMSAYPLTRKWLYTCVRNKLMPQRAYKILKHHFSSKAVYEQGK
jgi:hypothetical protein